MDKYALLDDEGRYQVTGNEVDRHVWRVLMLRNLVYMAPYFHNGGVKSLGEAVQSSTDDGITGMRSRLPGSLGMPSNVSIMLAYSAVTFILQPSL